MANTNDLLARFGFGESSLLKRRVGKSKIKLPNFTAMAESGRFVSVDRQRMALQNKGIKIAMQESNLRRLKGQAYSEDLSDITDKIKDGVKRVKDTIIELIEKAIRFFTETVRYWMSNERKIGKKLVSLKAAQKKYSSAAELKKGDKNTFVNWGGTNVTSAIDALTALNKAKSSGDDGTIGQDLTAIGNARDDSDNTGQGAVDKAKSLIETQKEKVDEVKEAVAAAIKDKEENKESKWIYTDLIATGKPLPLLIKALEDARKMENLGMRGLNKEIRKLQDDLKDLKKEFKENKDNSEEANAEYQKSRGVITGKVKYITAMKGIKDAVIGNIFRLGDAMISDINKAKKKAAS